LAVGLHPGPTFHPLIRSDFENHSTASNPNGGDRAAFGPPLIRPFLVCRGRRMYRNGLALVLHRSKGGGREGAQRYPSRFKSSMRSNHSSNVRTYSFEFGNCDENQVTSEVPEWRRASVSSSSFQSIRRHTPFLGDLRSIRLKQGRFWFSSE
jgi:hypothetical protein